MNTKTKDVGIFIGRFQPAHEEHMNIIGNMIKENDHSFILIGDSQKLTVRDPFTYDERVSIIKEYFSAALPNHKGWADKSLGRMEDDVEKLSFARIMDIPGDNSAWVTNVKFTVKNLVKKHFEISKTNHFIVNVKLYGYNKDESSFYLSLFPEWHRMGSTIIKNPEVSSTRIRDELYLGIINNTPFMEMSKTGFEGIARKEVISRILLKVSMASPRFKNLAEDWNYYKKYINESLAYKHKPMHATADAAVICNSHVLLIKRGKTPGKGLYALPGGFVEQGEPVLTAALRELKEETGLGHDLLTLTNVIVMDNPQRSLRGRVISHVHVFNAICVAHELLDVKAADDAEEAIWVHTKEALRMDKGAFFEDHYNIIENIMFFKQQTESKPYLLI